jgi:hypothetical protein
VREESHLDEMRSAIRGDFERLAERRGDQELMRVSEAKTEPEPELPLGGEPPSVLEPEPEQAEEDELEQPRRSWLARFLNP